MERKVQATEKSAKKKLLVDLDICGKCEECVIDCSYLYHPSNNGITYLREKATFEFICRHCEQGTCVTACPQDALQRDEEGIPQRSSFLCIGCSSCVAACPFGTIYKEVIPFYTSQCDVCVGRTNGKELVCVSSCPFFAIKYGDYSESPEENRYLVDENVVVHVTVWQREQEEARG